MSVFLTLTVTPEYNGKRLTKVYKTCCRDTYRIGKTKILKMDQWGAGRHHWTDMQTENEIQFYNEILKPEDRKYFPKLIESGNVYVNDDPYFWIIQEFINFKPQRGQKMSEEHKEILDYLIDKYNLWDIDFGDRYSSCHNWAINAKNNLPVIYDIGGYKKPKKAKKKAA